MARRRSRNKRRYSCPPKNQIKSVERRYVASIPKVTSDTGAYNSIIATTFPGSSDFPSLFQYYRIKKLRYTYMLVNAPNNNANFPTLYIAPQSVLASGTPLTRDEVLQYQGVKTHQFGPSNLKVSYDFVPHCNRDIQQNLSGGEMVTAPFLNAGNLTIAHFTNVYWLSRYNSTTDSTHTLDLEITAWFELKGTR